jgi:pimeloyl-ACP methyl ester carboxylesterase
MKKHFIISVIFIFCNFTFSQDIVKGTNYTHFQIKFKKDTIDFVVADTNLNIKKPLLLFCQGSQPIPLFIDFELQGPIPVTLNNFDLDNLNKHFHVIVISMPHTPIIVSKEYLNNQYNYITDTTNQYSYSIDYQKADYFENYVERANKVLDFLFKQKWVEKKELIIAGHSQGARIAVGIAASNKRVTKLGLFAYNPLGRIDQVIRQARKNAEKGKISWEEADSITLNQFEFLKLIQNKDSLALYPSLISWNSFSNNTFDKLIKLKTPIYIAYGSNDIVADFCDLLPLFFTKEKKMNYIVKRYPKLEHNFFPIDENDKIDYQNGQWKFVMNEFIQWAKSIN